MKKWLVVVLFFAANLSFSQEVVFELYSGPDVSNPVFEGGGIDKFNDFVKREFDFKKVTKPGKMVASFTITSEGLLTNIRIVQMIDVESAGEMIRVLKKSPKWQPAVRGGKPFAVDIKFPMEFK